MSKPLCWIFLTTICLLSSTPVALAFNVSLVNAPDSGKSSPIPPKTDNTYRIKTIVIDAGHGGHDPGCLGGNSQEKHIALAIAQNLAERIRTNFPDIQVILTRDDDTFIPLYERASIANRNHADLFISIHCNYMPGSQATSGSETYVMGLHTAEHNLEVAKRENEAILLEDDYEENYDYDPNSPEGHILLSMFQNAYLEQSILFAEKVEHHFHDTAERRSRGVKQAGFVVLKETAMPSVLVETGFLSNGAEETFLLSDEGQDLVSTALLEAFRDYKIAMEGPQAVASTPLPPVSTPVAPPASATQATPPPPSPTIAEAQPTVQWTPARATPVANTPATSTPQPRTPQANGVYQSPQPQVQREPVITARGSEAVRSSSTEAPRRTQQPVDSELGISFAVQLAASPQPLDATQPQWHNLGFLIEIVEEDRMFKYQARNFQTWASAFQAKLLLQQKGFPDAFIVAYQRGQRIPMQDARQQLGME